MHLSYRSKPITHFKNKDTHSYTINNMHIFFSGGPVFFNIQSQENKKTASYTHLPTVIIITMLTSRSGVSSPGLKTPERHPGQLVVFLHTPPPASLRAFALAAPPPGTCLPQALSLSAASSARPGLALRLLASCIFCYRALHSWASRSAFLCHLSGLHLPAGTDHEPRTSS